MKTRELSDRLLVAILILARRQGFDHYIEPLEAANELSLERTKGQLRLAVEGLNDRGLVELTQYLGGGEEGGMDIRLNARGVELAEEILEDHPEYGALPKLLDLTSERYLDRQSNEETLQRVSADVTELGRHVRAANELTEDERSIALSEIAVFETTLAQPKISTELVERFAARILRWLAQKFPEAAFSALVTALLTALMQLAQH